ncbi:putative enoyl CoA hydratase [Ascosphaera pollenicola]|nr:putative enoyl CoA hydratase [Ascosphaera pollenicola]
MADYTFQHYNVTFPVKYVAHVEINRPKALNAFHEAMWLEIRTVFGRLSRDANVRSVVLSGAGPRAFTSGLDVKAAAQDPVTNGATDESSDPSRKATKNRRYIDDFQDCISSIENCEKPIICVMHGYSFGLGIDISCVTDIRICAEDTKFSVKEVDVGMAADIGTLSRLPKIVGNISWVKEVTFTARIFGAQEALRQGFVSQVHHMKDDAIKAGLDLAGLIASKSPIGVQGTKELLNYSRDHSVAEGLRYTSVWNSAMLQTKDMAAALLSGIQKQQPTFSKL